MKTLLNCYQKTFALFFLLIAFTFSTAAGTEENAYSHGVSVQIPALLKISSESNILDFTITNLSLNQTIKFISNTDKKWRIDVYLDPDTLSIPLASLQWSLDNSNWREFTRNNQEIVQGAKTPGWDKITVFYRLNKNALTGAVHLKVFYNIRYL